MLHLSLSTPCKKPRSDENQNEGVRSPHEYEYGTHSGQINVKSSRILNILLVIDQMLIEIKIKTNAC